MNEAIMTFTLTLVATIIGGIIVEKFLRHEKGKALAQQGTPAQPPRHVLNSKTLCIKRSKAFFTKLESNQLKLEYHSYRWCNQ
jgi:hypothetical protein